MLAEGLRQKSFGRLRRTPLLSFRSLQRSLVTSRCRWLPRHRRFRFDVRDVPADFRFTLARAASASIPAAWPRRSTTSVGSPTPLAAGHASPLSSRRRSATRVRASRDLVGKDSPKRRSRLLMLRWGRRCICCTRTYSRGRGEHPVRSAPDSKFRPTIRARCAVGDSSDGTHGIFTLRRFAPDAGCESVSRCAGLRAVCRSLAAIYFRRGIVRPRGIQKRKRTGDHEFSVRFPGFVSRHRSALKRISRRLSRSCLGLCLFQVCGHPRTHLHRHDPVQNISLCRPFPAPIRSWV
jgi:hypothetical protein